VNQEVVLFMAVDPSARPAQQTEDPNPRHLAPRFEMRQLPVLLERVAQLERNTREIQERVMGIRMLPMGTAFSRFPPLVRDLAAKSGKKIQLVILGEASLGEAPSPYAADLVYAAYAGAVYENLG
jgi:hypothetical protein